MLRKKDALRENINENEIVLFVRDSGKSIVLNKTARVLYDLCDGASGEDVADLFSTLFGAVSREQRERLKQDATRALDSLRESGLVEDIAP
jgi:hypothetical protein